MIPHERDRRLSSGISRVVAEFVRIPRITWVYLNSHEFSDVRRTPSQRRRLVMLGCLWLWLAVAGHADSAAGQSPLENSDAPAASESADSATPIATDPQLKISALWLAFMMLAGIIFGGAILLALVVMWGNRTRRLARSPLPPVAKRNELWFLKPKSPADDADETRPSDSGSNAGP